MSDLHYLDLTEIARKVQSRELSSVEVTQHLLDRITQLDERLGSYATVTPEIALTQAATADAEIGRGEIRGPLHGVPVGIKDLCATKDAPTHVGSTALRNWNPGVDCTVVARLRAAGAVFLGKLQMTESAYAVYHPDITPVLNPWSDKLWTGVSSSGPAVATVAGLCFGSIGTDTGGSIRFPAHCCGVTGIKPTYGRVSRAGIHAMSDSLDHAGPLARTAADAAALLGIIAGYDPQDPTSVPARVPDYLVESSKGIAGLRIGFDDRIFTEGIDPAVTAMLHAVMAVLRDRGAVMRAIRFPDTDAVVRAWTPIFRVEAARSNETTYPARKEQYGPAFAQVLEEGLKTSPEAYAEAQNIRRAFTTTLASTFDEVDLILSPSLPYPTPTNAFMDHLGDEEGALERLIAFTAPHNMTGNPTISLPGGFTADGRPIGFQLVGPHWGEAELIRAGHAYQLETNWHQRQPSLPDLL